MTYDILNEKNGLYHLCRGSINLLEKIWAMIEESGMQNEQFTLDWLDKLNEISIRN